MTAHDRAVDPTSDNAPGRPILVAGWIANALFAVTAIPAAIIGEDGIEAIAIAVALLLFFIAIGTFAYAFAIAVARSTRGDNIAVASLFFLEGSAPRQVRRDFFVLFLACLAITAATAAWEPFGVLVPMLPIGLAGLWAARHGKFGPRPPQTPRRRV